MWPIAPGTVPVNLITDPGHFDEAKGKVKEVLGRVIDNPEVEAEGTAEKVAGIVQKKVGQIKTVLGK